MTVSAEILTRTVIRFYTPSLLTSSHFRSLLLPPSPLLFLTLIRRRYVLMVCTLQVEMISKLHLELTSPSLLGSHDLTALWNGIYFP
jgi:hypothetical protein